MPPLHGQVHGFKSAPAGTHTTSYKIFSLLQKIHYQRWNKCLEKMWNQMKYWLI